MTHHATIQAIIFDCFGVLTTDLWRAFLDDLPPHINTDRARELNRQYAAGLISRSEFLDQVQAVTGSRPQDVERLLDDQIIKNTPLLDYIRSLRARGYRIGMLSNIASNWIRDRFLTDDEQALFDHMIFSYEVGLTKPDPRIFALACHRLDVKPNQAVLIDDIPGYCQAAQAQGMQAIVYTDFSQFKRELSDLLKTNTNTTGDTT